MHKKVVKDKTMYKESTDKCTHRNNDENTDDCYIQKLTRGRLIITAKIVTGFVSKAFAILDF